MFEYCAAKGLQFDKGAARSAVAERDRRVGIVDQRTGRAPTAQSADSPQDLAPGQRQPTSANGLRAVVERATDTSDAVRAAGTARSAGSLNRHERRIPRPRGPAPGGRRRATAGG